MTIFSQASFKCKLKKWETRGFNITLDYYTKDSGFVSLVTVHRTCTSCSSKLNVCSGTDGRVVSLEYLSLMVTSTQPMQLNDRFCQQSKIDHTSCLNLTQPEYVFKYYLNRRQNYPQLLLIFSSFAHDNGRPLEKVYNNMKYLMNVTTSYVPQLSDVIWYDSSPWYANKHFHWYTPEGQGYNPNEKIRAENAFLSRLVSEHRTSWGKPRIHSFFDLYHMQEQLRQKWYEDHIHSIEAWYRYVMGYTAAMLPSLL